MSNDAQSARWICASCGARHEERNPPCTSCAGEEFAKLEASSTERIEQSADVAWICEDCGTRSPRNNTACKECGGFDYAQLASGQANPSQSDGFDGSVKTSTSPDSGRDSQYYIGVVLGVIGVLVFPYFLIFVALPEAAGSWWGRSTLDLLGRDARDNPFMKGTFLIIRWFGNFLWLCFGLGLLLGIGLVLL